MAKNILLLYFTFFVTVVVGQTVIVSPTGDGGFETGTTFASNGWMVVNGTQTNKWWCGNIPTGLTGMRCAYISNNGSGNTHNYAVGSTSVTHVYRDVTFPAAQTCINLSFSWVGDGEDGFFGNYDFLSVHIVSTATTITAGTVPGGQIGGDFLLQTTWQSASMALPAAYAGTTQRLVFTWRNDGSAGFQPPAAIDNVSITSSNGAPNDAPCNAATIAVNNSCIYGAYNNNCATNTTTPGAPGCASYNGADVWYKATVPASGKINFDSNIGAITDGGMAVYSGTCSSLTLISCDDDASVNGTMPAINISGQTPGSEVFIRFWAYGAAQSGSFQLCAYDPCPTGPGTCSSLLGTGVTTVSSLPYASGAGTTNGMGDDLTSTNTATCGASYYLDGLDRVWIFTPTVSGSVTINLTSTGSYTGLMLYDDCPISTACVTAVGNCIAYAQSSTGNKTLNVCVTAGVTYYLVLDSWPSPMFNDYSNLTISAPTGASAINDLPCNATPLPLGVNLNGDNGCTNGTNEPVAPGCWVTPNVRNTVWYSVVPTGTTLKIRTTPGTLRNTQIAVYSGACGPGMTLVNCNDDAAPCGSTAATISDLYLTGLTPGTTYFVVVDGYGDQYGTFSIMAIDGAQVYPPIFGQECQVPNPVCNQTIAVGNPGYQLFGTSCDFPGSGTNCLLSGERGSAWYEIQINGNGILTFNIVPNDWPGAPSTVGTDYDFAMWKKTGSGAVTCTDIANGATPIRCNYSYLGVTGLFNTATNIAPPAYPNFDAAYEAQLNVVNGEVYWLVISNFSNSTSGFTMTFGASSPINYTPNPGYVVWSGGVNTDWFNTGNWGGCAIPSCTIDAIIPPSSSNQPIISAPGAACKNITINAGSSLGINAGFQLQVCGNYINTGTLNAAPTSTVLLNNGNINQTMDGNMVGTSSFGNVTVTKTGGLVTTLDNITMKGNFTVSNASSTFEANSKNHLLAGHFINTGGTYTSGVSGYLELNGAAIQDYQNAGTINHCNVNKGGGHVNLLTNLTLGTNGNLSLNNGNILTNPAYMVIVNNRNIASCTPGHNASFVNGTLRRYINPTGSYNFPVGNTAKGYQRANVNFAYPGNPTSIDHLTASFNNYISVPGGIGGNECGNTYTSPALNNGYWTITASNNATSGNYDMTLYNQNHTNATTAWTVMKNSGGGWGLWNGTCVACPVGNVTRLNMNGFSDFGVAQAGAPLPVNFLSFDAIAKTNSIALDWTTTNEKDNHHFDLLRSIDNANFEKIADIPPSLNNGSNKQYFYKDEHVKKGQRYYYQVRQVDINGESTNSGVRDAIIANNSFGFAAQPNPFEKNTMLHFELENSAFVKLSIYNANGQLVALLANGILDKGKQAYLFAPESPGHYTAQLVVGENVIFIRLVNFE